MKKISILVLVLFILGVAPSFLNAKNKNGTVIKVGVYQSTPLIILDKNGKPEGFYIDILKYIADKEGWNLEYVPGTWPECIDRISDGRIDLLVGVPHIYGKTEKYYLTSEILLSNWAQVYTRKNSGIQAIVDLENRNVAGVKGDIYFEDVKSLIESFGLESNFLEVENYDAVLKLVDKKLADAGVVSRIYGTQNERKYSINRTSIICSPTELRFALPLYAKGVHERALMIDAHIISIKNDKNSVYYRSLNKWFGGVGGWVFPAWLIFVLIAAGIVLCVSFVLAFMLRKKVGEKTSQLVVKTEELASSNKELQDEIKERSRVQEKLIEAHQLLEKRVDERTSELAKANEVLKKEIDDRKAAEEKLKETAKELARSNEDLAQFAYAASHDLQEPLRMVSSYLKLIEERYKDKIDQDANEFIAYAVEGSERMRSLIDSLLEYSHLGSEAKKFELVDCNGLFSVVLDNLSMIIQNSNTKVITEGLPRIMADAAQLSRLFQNLVSNAIKFNKNPNPEILVKAVRQEGEWLFSVRDNGIGIEPKNFSRIFGIFHRLHTREEYPGTGIGLAICKKIIDRHDGRIWLESELGRGSTFFFTIPDKLM